MPKPRSTLSIGMQAESRAARHLEAFGVRVIARNLRSKRGEIDLVCLDGAILVIVEVRKRTRGDFGGALASVTHRKQRRLIVATAFHWQRHPEWHRYRLRFDVVALQGRADGTDAIDWIKDAFRAT